MKNNIYHALYQPPVKQNWSGYIISDRVDFREKIAKQKEECNKKVK